jgi:predicted Zn finger-like uncharacterized protein
MVITVSCSACAASFPVDPNKIPEGGVKVRCSECAHVFRVERPAPEPELAPSPADDERAAEPEPELAPPPPDEEWAVEPEPPATDVETGGTDPGGSTSIAADIDEGDELPDWATGLDAGGTEATEVPDALDEVPEEPRPEEPRPEPTGWADPAPDASGWDQLEDEPDTGALPDDPLPVMEPDPPPATEPDPLPVMEAQPAPVTEPEPSPPAEPETVPGFSFGKRDPMDKARRLARVLVSDMVMYNSERHQVALSRGTLAEDFEEEIEKSWKEYVDQIGNEIAEGEGRHFWSQALNDILAKGAKEF